MEFSKIPTILNETLKATHSYTDYLGDKHYPSITSPTGLLRYRYFFLSLRLSDRLTQNTSPKRRRVEDAPPFHR